MHLRLCLFSCQPPVRKLCNVLRSLLATSSNESFWTWPNGTSSKQQVYLWFSVILTFDRLALSLSPSQPHAVRKYENLLLQTNYSLKCKHFFSIFFRHGFFLFLFHFFFSQGNSLISLKTLCVFRYKIVFFSLGILNTKKTEIVMNGVSMNVAMAIMNCSVDET